MLKYLLSVDMFYNLELHLKGQDRFMLFNCVYMRLTLPPFSLKQCMFLLEQIVYSLGNKQVNKQARNSIESINIEILRLDFFSKTT